MAGELHRTAEDGIDFQRPVIPAVVGAILSESDGSKGLKGLFTHSSADSTGYELGKRGWYRCQCP